MRRLMESYVTAMLTFPEQAHRFLSVAGGRCLAAGDRPAERRSQDRMIVTVGVLLAIAGVLIVPLRFGQLRGRILVARWR
jgi:hypothetical protein